MYYPFIDNLLPFRKKKYNIESLNIYQFLFQRYGINKNVSKLLCLYSGFNNSLKIASIRRSYICDRMVNFFSKNLNLLDKKLKEKSIQNISKLMKLHNYKGMRHINKYPTRGQRTRTNAQTRKKSLGLHIK